MASPSLNLLDFMFATICLRTCVKCQGWTRHEQYTGLWTNEGRTLYYCLECGHKWQTKDNRDPRLD